MTHNTTKCFKPLCTSQGQCLCRVNHLSRLCIPYQRWAAPLPPVTIREWAPFPFAHLHVTDLDKTFDIGIYVSSFGAALSERPVLEIGNKLDIRNISSPLTSQTFSLMHSFALLTLILSRQLTSASVKYVESFSAASRIHTLHPEFL